ncbi:nitrilase-related carbon-nitrogen hydrolase [Desulfitobacterium chlororespirans]|uniref:Predicted amidohydrolase n=1 Tax=Desulfitobacterium chlororespirans DSM 11544 TaxID=1121395 RepID=A0A1M7SER3_9FIRM|nr:nitrilase-related carbon-nitrogen hydrolase [Desulfitobacterium chlororespirans]SHN56960.1 Predicted amidohydrolase [Desulfitobacterium chlororespirans DSM 11544]
MRLACLQVEAQDWQNSKKAWLEIRKLILEAAQHHDLIIVPESVYPAYFLPQSEKPDTEDSLEEIFNELKEICKKTQTYLAFGYADNNQNLASLLNPKGEEIAKKSKSNLWHFDKRWFTQGAEVVTADTEYGKVGIVICADARLPELVRSVALENVKLIIDLANLTATGPELDKLSNAQSDYMLATRARENKVWLAVADKWGIEADTVTYAGRSAVYSPDGTCVAKAPSDRNMIVSAEIPTDANGEIQCTSDEELPVRHPDLYSILATETIKLPVYRYLAEAVIPELLTPYVIVNSLANHELSQGTKIKHIKRVLEQEPDLIILPTSINEEDIAEYQSLLKDNQFIVLSEGSDGQTRTRLIDNKEILASYITVDSVPQKDPFIQENNFPVIRKLPFGRIGFLHEKEMLLPEAARCSMLNGADAIIWQHGMSFAKAAPLARTRAAENRIFIFAVYSDTLGDSPHAASFIVDPAGNIIASTLFNRPLHATGAYCNFCNARLKSVVPGTHIVFDRRPRSYEKMVQS